MQRISIKLPHFTAVYDGTIMRALVRMLEQALYKVYYDNTKPITEVSGAHTLGRDDSLLLVDTTAGSVAITLPESTDDLIDVRHTVNIKKTVAANTITLTPSGADTVDGAASMALTAINSAVTLRAVLGGWIAISGDFSASSSSGAAFTQYEANLGSVPVPSGSFTIAGTGLTTGKPVLIAQAAAAYTGKGTYPDEIEMDQITISGYVQDATTIKCHWGCNTLVRGNVKFNYLVGA